MLLENWLREPARQNKSGRADFSGFFLTSTNGTLVAASTDAPGFTLTRTAAGRYTVQLINSRGEPVTVGPVGPLKLTPGLLGFNVAIITPAGNIGSGRAIAARIRGALTTLATAGNFVIQFDDATATEADVTDGSAFIVEFSVKRSSAVP